MSTAPVRVAEMVDASSCELDAERRAGSNPVADTGLIDALLREVEPEGNLFLVRSLARVVSASDSSVRSQQVAVPPTRGPGQVSRSFFVFWERLVNCRAEPHEGRLDVSPKTTCQGRSAITAVGCGLYPKLGSEVTAPKPDAVVSWLFEVRESFFLPLAGNRRKQTGS